MQEDLRREVETRYFQELYKTIPKVRLARYLIPNIATTQIDVLTLYMYNAAVSQSLYVPLQNFEVGLRNGLHAVLIDKLHTEEWYNKHFTSFGTEGQRSLTKALNDAKNSKIGPQPGDVIAALTLGFWHSLFHENCWAMEKPDHIKMVFPNLPDEYINVTRLCDLIDDIKNLRNRISHYERIWNLESPSVDALYHRLLKMIGWMSPELKDLTKMDDQYPRLMKVGRVNYQEECRKRLEKHFEREVKEWEVYLAKKAEAKRLEEERKKIAREAIKAAGKQSP